MTRSLIVAAVASGTTMARTGPPRWTAANTTDLLSMRLTVDLAWRLRRLTLPPTMSQIILCVNCTIPG